MTKKNSKRERNGALVRRHRITAQKAVARGRAAKAANVNPAALKFEEARIYLGGISTPSMMRLIARGLLRPNRNLRHHIFPKAELDRFLREGMTE